MDRSNARFFVAAVGASAGGLEPLLTLLEQLSLSSEQLALIVLLHQSPSSKSHLAELIRKRSSWPVIDGLSKAQALLPGCVYVVPPNVEARLEADSICLNPVLETTGPRPSANLLFASLAEQTLFHPIAIVLSGTGDDGAQGLAEIHRSGGWTFAQLPETAQFQGMPSAAIETGEVDYVLPPDQISLTLQHLLTQTDWGDETPAEAGFFGELLTQLKRRFGTDFSAYKSPTLVRRMQRRQLLLNLPSQQAYCEYVTEQPQELDELYQSLLISVTSFFRDPEAFTVLGTALQTALQSKPEGETLRIWIPGCATGEEAYSIAFLIHSLLGKTLETYPLQIFATDIDEPALLKARRGYYSAAALEAVPQALREAYFQPQGDGYEVCQQIRSQILFAQHDLTQHPPFARLDLVSCRNVLIYFSPQLQKQILASFHYALNADGLLLLGGSESTSSQSKLFLTVDTHTKLFRRLQSTESVRPMLSTRLQQLTRVEPAGREVPHHLRQVQQETLFAHQPHPLLVLNEDFEILEIHGDMSPFLSFVQGRMTTQATKLCHEDLQWELRSLLTQAHRERRARTGTYRCWPAQQSQQFLRLRALPGKGILLVLFEILDLSSMGMNALSPTEQLLPASLEQELALSRVQMQAFVEELEATSEELQTANEELLSANEELHTLNQELQSANEELQLANEELETANLELQTTHGELQRTHSELQSAHQNLATKEQILQISQSNLQALLENTVQAFLLMDSSYRLVSYNPQALNIHNTIYGRPLKEGMSLVDAFDDQSLPEILPLIREALDGRHISRELAFESPNGRFWFAYHLMPVYLPDNTLSGLSISALDITAQKEAELALHKSTALLNSVFNATEMGICVISADGVILQTNQGLSQILGYPPEALLDQAIEGLVPAEHRAKIRAIHSRFFELGEEDPFEWQFQRPDGRFIDLQVSARRVSNPDGSWYRVSTILDVTESKKNRQLLQDTQEMTGIGGWEIILPSEEMHWTPELYSIYGIAQNTPIDLDNALQSYLPESRARLQNALQRAKEYGDPYDLELEFIRPNGEQVWVRATCRVTQQKGQTIRLNGTFQDISQRRQAEEASEKLALVAQQIPSLVMITNSQFQIDYVNDAFCAETGYSESQAQGRNALFLQGPETAAVTLQRLQLAQQSAQVAREEILLYNCLGQTFWYELQLTPVLNAEGEARYFILLLINITQRKQREALLLFQSDILGHVNDSIIVCDLNGQITYWNKGAETIYGYSAAEMLGQPMKLLNPNFDTAQFLELYHKGQNPYIQQPEIERSRKDGRKIWLSVVAEVIYNAHQQPIGIIGVAKDVTLKKEMEIALRHREETFQAMLENSADGIMVAEPNGNVSYLSASAERLLGYPAPELENFLARVHPEESGLLVQQLNSLHAGHSYLGEYRFRHQTGRWIWLEATHKNMLHEPHLKGLIYNFRDISQRKETQQELQLHEQLYRSIAENFPNGSVTLLDQQLNLLFTEGQETLPGVFDRAWRHDSESFPQGQQIVHALQAALEGSQQHFELHLQDNDYLVSVVPLPGESDLITRLLVVNWNVTAQKRASEEKNRLIQELTSKNEDLNQFTYIISHNLRLPVANLLGLVNLLELEAGLEPTVRELVRHVSTTSAQLDRVILDLNDILNLRRRRDELCQEVNLEQEYQHLLGLLEPTYPDVKQWVQANFELQSVYTIRSYLQSMMYNLVSNALKYRHPERQPEIQITVRQLDEQVSLEVSDNGLGIDLTRHRSQLFRLYKRFHLHLDGKGMGLYLVKTQAESLSGSVDVSSVPGQGSQFQVVFKEAR